MSDKQLVEIICDGNPEIGLGHIRRSTALAVALQKENIEIRLIGLSEEANKWLPAMDRGKHKASVVVFDVSEGIDQAIEHAKQNGQTTVTLDWFGNAIPHINIAVYPHSEVKAVREKYTGFEYIILRDEIRKLSPKPFNGQTNKVLICLGGGDLLGQGFDTAKLLAQKGFQVTLVQGPLAKNLPGEHGFKVLVTPPDFPELLAGCDWAVTNGGGCLFEAIYLQKAVYVLPQTEWENRIAVFAKKNNAVSGIGMQQLESLSAKQPFPLVQREKKIVDGYGVERITGIIKKLV